MADVRNMSDNLTNLIWKSGIPVHLAFFQNGTIRLLVPENYIPKCTRTLKGFYRASVGLKKGRGALKIKHLFMKVGTKY